MYFKNNNASHQSVKCCTHHLWRRCHVFRNVRYSRINRMLIWPLNFVGKNLLTFSFGKFRISAITLHRGTRFLVSADIGLIFKNFSKNARRHSFSTVRCGQASSGSILPQDSLAKEKESFNNNDSND